MSDNVIGYISCYVISIDGQGAQALGTSSIIRMRLKFRIGSQVPLKNSSAPVPGRADGQILRMPSQVATKRTFG